MGFFSDFFGGSARRDIKNAKAKADTALSGGYNEANTTATDYGNQAMGFLQPGLDANKMYANSLGLNGAEGGQNALLAYQQGSNPHLGFMQDQAQRGTDRMANARGSLNSGANALAASRVRQEMGYKDYAGWQDRLGQMGTGAATTGATLKQNQGQYLGDLRWNYGQSQAGNEVNYGNAMASARNIGINNLIGLVGATAKAASAAMGGK